MRLIGPSPCWRQVCRYMPHEETRRLFLRKHHLSAEAAALPCPGLGAVHQWAHMLDGLYLCVLLQLHHRRQMAEAGVALRAVYQLAEAIRSRAVRVPIRKQDGRVQEQFSLRSDHPVLGQVTTVLLDYGLVYLQIGWHRPAVVQVMREGGWTDGLRALRRGDRVLLWVTGLQRNHMGHELVVATFQPPNQVCLSLDLPPSLLRHRVPSHQQLQLGLPPGRALSPPVTTAGGGGGGPLSPLLALPPLIALSPPGSAGGVRRCSSNSGGGQGCSSPTFDHLLPPAAAAAPLTEGPSMLLDVRSSITSMGTGDARSTVALPDLAKAGGGGMIIAPQPAHQQRPGSAELAVAGGGDEQPQPHVVLIESLVQELNYGVEFQDPDCPEPLLGLRALGERLDLRAAGVSSAGTVTLDGPMDAVLEALDRVIRIAARWAVSANDQVSLAGLDMKYVSPRPVWLPSLQACSSSARFSGPLGHPYHALEEEMWPRRFALVPLLLQDHEQQPSGAYLIVAESVDVAEGGLETVAQWERQEAEEDRARKAKADAKAPLLFSPTSGTLAARKAASASHSPGGGGEAALRRPQS